jgi:hypothetical protein
VTAATLQAALARDRCRRGPAKEQWKRVVQRRPARGKHVRELRLPLVPPVARDSRDLVVGAFHRHVSDHRIRPPSIEYLTQVALAAESAGLLGALIPTGAHCEDAWLVAASVAAHTRTLKPLEVPRAPPRSATSAERLVIEPRVASRR